MAMHASVELGLMITWNTILFLACAVVGIPMVALVHALSATVYSEFVLDKVVGPKHDVGEGDNGAVTEDSLSLNMGNQGDHTRLLSSSVEMS